MSLTIKQKAKRKNDLDRMTPAAWNAKLGTVYDLLIDQLAYPVFTVGTEATNVINVTVQMTDAEGNALEAVQRVDYTISDAASGAPTTDPPSGGVTASTGILFGFTSGATYLESTPDVIGWLQTDSTGKVVVAITETGVDTFYLNVVAGGKVYSSGAIIFA